MTKQWLISIKACSTCYVPYSKYNEDTIVYRDTYKTKKDAERSIDLLKKIFKDGPYTSYKFQIDKLA